MKKLVWLLLAVLILGALDLLPFESREVSALLPVKTILVMRSGEEYTVDVGAGVRAVGQSLKEALRRLCEESPGEVFLPTAEQVVLTEPADEAIEAVAEETAFRPAAGICVTPDADPDVEALGRYLEAHPLDYTVLDLRAALLEGRKPELPVVRAVDGGWRVEK